MINILFYIPDLSKSQGGIYQYACSLLRMLGRLDNGKYKIFIYHKAGDKLVHEIINSELSLKLLTTQFSPVVSKTRRIKSIVNKFFRRKIFKIPSFENWITHQFDIDIFHCPKQQYIKVDNVKVITTVHDVQELYFPEYFTPEQRATRALNCMNAIRCSHKVIVTFDHIKRDVIRFFQKEEESVEVLFINMHHLWFKKFDSLKEFRLNESLNSEKFLLYPAATWEHKNHIALIEAVNLIKTEKNQIVNVICTGHKTDFYSRLETLIKEHNLQEQVKFLGIVPEDTLFRLYKKCCGVVIPTRYEAGSFPLIESMLMEVPVICSNVTSLPNTIQNDKFLFDPHDINSMANKILTLYNQESFRRENIRNSIEKRS